LSDVNRLATAASVLVQHLFNFKTFPTEIFLIRNFDIDYD